MHTGASERALVLGECTLAPAVLDSSVVRFHARVGEGGASAHTPPGVDDGGKTPPRPGVGNRCGARAAEWERTFLIHIQAP